MKFKDWKPVFLSCCLVVTSIGSPGKVFAETKADYVNAETVFEECPLNQISTMDYNGDLSTWTEVSEYWQVFSYDSSHDPFLFGNMVSFDLPSVVNPYKWTIQGRVPYKPSKYGYTYDLLAILDFGSMDISSYPFVNTGYIDLYAGSSPWYNLTPSHSSHSDDFVNDGSQIWLMWEGLTSLTSPCIGFGFNSYFNKSSYGVKSGNWVCHLYWRENPPKISVNAEGGGSSGGGDSGSGGGSGGSSST